MGQRGARDDSEDEEAREIRESELEHGGGQGRYARAHEGDDRSFFPAEGDQPE